MPLPKLHTTFVAAAPYDIRKRRGGIQEEISKTDPDAIDGGIGASRCAANRAARVRLAVYSKVT